MPITIHPRPASQLLKVFRLYAKDHPVGTKEYGEFIEEVRILTILTQFEFRKYQKNGSWTDRTGDLFIQKCLETIKE